MTVTEECRPALSLATLTQSPKREGKFERDIIPKVASFFEESSYQTKEHVCMNLAWGTVLSEIDLIAAKQEELAIIEIKSKRDKINRAKKQLEKVRVLADYCFIASDTIVNPRYLTTDTGILFVSQSGITVVRHPQKINDPVSKEFLLTLKKNSLDALCQGFGFKRVKDKKKLADFLVTNSDPITLKRKVRSIALTK